MYDITRINNLPLGKFHASLLEYNSGALTLGNNYFKAENRLRMTVFPTQIPLRSITIKLEFIGNSDHEAESNASTLIQTLANETELLLPDNYLYRCILQKTGKPVRKARGIFQREVSLIGYRHGKMECKSITESGANVFIKGNYKTEVRFTLTASDTNISVNGITVSNVSTGSTVIIDGIDCFVTQDGNNKFDDCDLTEFPSLLPGNREITFIGADSVKIEYYPIYY